MTRVFGRPGRIPVHGTRRDAERELSRLLVAVDEGRHVASPTMTLDGLLDRRATCARHPGP